MSAGPVSVRGGPVPGLADLPARTVTFAAAAESQAYPLTWAQRHMLMLIEALEPRTESVNLKFSFPLRPGVSEEDVLDALRDLVESHQALRTVYVPPPEGPAQRVLGSGTLTVPVLAAGKGTSVSTAARAAQDMWSEPFDIAGEWPIRVALVTVDGMPRHLVIAACHLVLDQAGGTWIEHHLRGILARPPAAVRRPAVSHQPVDEVVWERSEAGRRRAERALAHHERTFRAMPQTMLPRPAVATEPPRYRYLRFDSAALALAVAGLARRHNVSPAAVLYAGLCVISGFVSGLDRAFLQLTVGNRTATRTRFAVGMYTQDVPAYLDLGDASVPDVITRAGLAVTEAARFGQYPPDELAARRRAVELDRGIAFDLSCWLNYREAGARRRTSGDRAPADLTGRTRWQWTGGVDSSTSTYFVMADDTGDMMRLTVLLDTAVLPPAEGVAWLRALEGLLCTATTTEIGTSDVGARTGLTPARRADGWYLTEGGWAHLPSVAALVREAAGSRRADVFAVPSQGGHHRLHAFLDGTEPAIDIPRLHADCVGALPGMRTAIAPHDYVVCSGSPSSPDLAAWRSLPVLTAATGRPART